MDVQAMIRRPLTIEAPSALFVLLRIERNGDTVTAGAPPGNVRPEVTRPGEELGSGRDVERMEPLDVREPFLTMETT